MTLLSALEADPDIEITRLSETHYQQRFELFSQHLDKEWSLNDCVSFVLMDQRGLTDALTANEHFQQAGFRALL